MFTIDAFDDALDRFAVRGSPLQVPKTPSAFDQRAHKRGVDLISDALPFGRLWYADPNAVANAIGYAEHYSRSHDVVIRVYDAAGNAIETHEHKGDFKD